MKFLSRKHTILPTYNQLQIIKKLLNNKDSYEFYNIYNIFFLDEYHEYIRIPQLGDIRIIDNYIKLNGDPRIVKVVLFKKLYNHDNQQKNNINDNIINDNIIHMKGDEYYLMINSIIDKNEELIIDILTNIHRKDKKNITLADINKIYNQKIEDLEKNVEAVKKKMDRLSTHSKFYWKMQKQLSKKEMRLMNAKMNKYEDILKCEEESKTNNIMGITGFLHSSSPIIENNFIDKVLNNNQQNKQKKEIVYIIDKNKPKQEIVYIDVNRKFKDLK